jgi:conjugative transfer signal peptidase TraF
MTRFGFVMSTYFAVLGIVASALFHPQPRLIWNASASVPIGLYRVHSAFPLHVDELVVVDPPKPLADFLDARRYLPRGVPMLKYVVAVPGQTVCRLDRTISIDGTHVGDALGDDRRGRPLPVWRGCRRVAIGEVFLMNRQSKDSFDGRYFGPLPSTVIVGQADPVWLPKEN